MFENLDLKKIAAFAVGGVLTSNITHAVLATTAFAVFPPMVAAGFFMSTAIQICSVVGFFVGGYGGMHLQQKWENGWRPQMPKLSKPKEQSSKRYGQRFTQQAEPKTSLFSRLKEQFTSAKNNDKKADQKNAPRLKKEKKNTFKF